MTLSTRQIRAARGLLGLSQAELCSLARLSKNSLCDLEQGKVMPRLHTLEKLRHVFETHGIVFLANDGVQMRQEIFNIYTMEGDNIWQRHAQDQIDTMRRTGETILHHADDAAFFEAQPDLFFYYYDQMLKYKLKERLLLPEKKPFRYAPLQTTECRVSPRDVVGYFGYSIFGDKFSLYLPDRIAVIENKTIADTYRQQFEYDWKRGVPLPTMMLLYEKELKKRGLNLPGPPPRK